MSHPHHQAEDDTAPGIPLREGARVLTDLKTIGTIIGGTASLCVTLVACFYHVFSKMDSVRIDALVAAEKLSIAMSNQWDKVNANSERQYQESFHVKDYEEAVHQSKAIDGKMPEVGEVLRVTRPAGSAGSAN